MHHLDDFYYALMPLPAAFCYAHSITPNMVTALAILPRLISLYCLFQNQFLAATLFTIGGDACDHLDGFLARAYNQASPFGALFDFSADLVNGLALMTLTYFRLHHFGFWRTANAFGSLALAFGTMMFVHQRKIWKNRGAQFFLRNTTIPLLAPILLLYLLNRK